VGLAASWLFHARFSCHDHYAVGLESWIALMKRSLYRALARAYPPERESLALRWLTRNVQASLGRATVSLGGVKLKLGPADLLDRFLLLGRNINPFFISACKQYIGEGGGGIAVDVGANAGVLSVLAARERNATVLAFEPSLRELSRLYENVLLNGFHDRITVFPFALSDRCGERQLFVADERNSGGNSLFPIDRTRSSATVRAARFDSLFSPELLAHVRVVKLDVEGAELETLLGMSDAMEHLRRAVFIVEMSPGFLALSGAVVDRIYAFFDSFGFSPSYGIQVAPQWEEVFLHPKFSGPLRFTPAV
jgi:FkbM family methyltransferase